MAATLTATLLSSSQATVGRFVSMTMTLGGTGGTPWNAQDALTTGPFTLSGGSGTYIVNQKVVDGGGGTNTTAVLTIYTGETVGTLTITDTVNTLTATIQTTATLVQRHTGGTTYYVQGGLAQPQAPLATVAAPGTGSLALNYQIIARNALGSTAGRTGTAGSFNNMNADAVYNRDDFLLAAAPTLGATSATLTDVWTSGTGTYTTEFGTGATRDITYTEDSTSITWTGALLEAEVEEAGCIIRLQATPAFSLTLVVLPPLVNSGITTVMKGGTTVTLTWPTVPGATSYDVLCQSANPDDPAVWRLLANQAQSGTGLQTYAHVSNAGDTYSLPTTDTTSSGDDLDNGLTAETAFATLDQALLMVEAGDAIKILGWVSVTTDYQFPDSVHVFTDDPGSNGVCYVGLTTTKAVIKPGSSSDWINVGFRSNVPGVILFGRNTGDTVIGNPNDVRLYNCRGHGSTNALRFAASTSAASGGYDFYDCIFSSNHGSFGMTTSEGCVFNLTRTSLLTPGGFIVQGTASIALQFQRGFVCLRDSAIYSGTDSQNAPQWHASCLWSNSSSARAMTAINSRFYGDTSEFHFGSGNATGITFVKFINTALDPAKNSMSIDMLGAKYTNTLAGTYQVDPLTTVPLEAAAAAAAPKGLIVLMD